MKISLRNIGMLDEADFEVGALTLICGENNTGKTYATYSLYGYLDFIGDNPAFNTFAVIQQVVKNNLNLIEVEDCIMQVSIPNMSKILREILSQIYKSYKNSLVEIFAGKDDDFNNSEFKDDKLSKVIDRIENINDEQNKKVLIDLFSHSLVFELISLDDKTFVLSYEKSKIHFNESMKNDVNIKKQQLWLVLMSYLYKMIYPNPFILSAERTGASMFQKELDVNKNEIVEKISRANGKNIQAAVFNVLKTQYSRYPKPVKDNIYFVRELDETIKRLSFIKKNMEKNNLYKQIIETLHDIIGGKYIVTQEGIEFAPGAKQRITKKGKISLQRASSSVRSLLMLNFYILNVAQKGDILMIDEPELNLHPKNQILMGRLITLLVNAGIKVFITTHSDYIVRELSNCIMLNNLTDEQIKNLKNGYVKEYKLQDSKVRAYLAENINGKNTLKNVDVDSKQGIFMETFNEPIDSQNENQGLIFEATLESKENNDQ